MNAKKIERFIPFLILFFLILILFSFIIYSNRKKNIFENLDNKNETWTFTNANGEGSQGPSPGSIFSEYNGTTLEGKVTMNTRGIQEWTVPASGKYKIEAWGASGAPFNAELPSQGNNGPNVVNGGKGVKISGEFILKRGDKIYIAVGQKGLLKTKNFISTGLGPSNPFLSYGGGGGGTFVTKGSSLANSEPLIVSGGGGGGWFTNNNTNGMYGWVSASYGKNAVYSQNAGGTSGYGGTNNGSGAGMYGNGQDAKSFLNGAVGGSDGCNYGGFGGGGFVCYSSNCKEFKEKIGSSFYDGPLCWGQGGGGGGYSGGNAGNGKAGNYWNSYGAPSNDYGGGGGGGSYNLGIEGTQKQLGFNSGHGKVIITSLEPVTTTPKPVNCEVSEWGNWGACNKSCDGGTQTRTRTIVKNSKNGGAACPTLSQTQSCNTQPCPVNCEVSEWGNWGACNKSCDGGTQTRTRTIVKNSKNGGTACPSLTETQACNTQPCTTTTTTMVPTTTKLCSDEYYHLKDCNKNLYINANSKLIETKSTTEDQCKEICCEKNDCDMYLMENDNTCNLYKDVNNIHLYCGAETRPSDGTANYHGNIKKTISGNIKSSQLTPTTTFAPTTTMTPTTTTFAPTTTFTPTTTPMAPTTTFTPTTTMMAPTTTPMAPTTTMMAPTTTFTPTTTMMAPTTTPMAPTTTFTSTTTMMAPTTTTMSPTTMIPTTTSAPTTTTVLPSITSISSPNTKISPNTDSMTSETGYIIKNPIKCSPDDGNKKEDNAFDNNCGETVNVNVAYNNYMEDNEEGVKDMQEYYFDDGL